MKICMSNAKQMNMREGKTERERERETKDESFL